VLRAPGLEVGSANVSEALAQLLDLKTAWRRVKDDLANRVFIRHPYSVSLVESDLDGWLETRLKLIREGTYAPESVFVCDVPKENGLIRPGAHLSYTDRLVYTACVGACYPAIHKTLRWSQGTIDFSYRLSTDAASPKWLRDRFTGWQDFRQKSIAFIDVVMPYVVITDITAFYENIDLSLLLSDLRATGAPTEAIAQIGTCLNKWAQVPGRGIPQGQSPSDILAKLYLNNIDKNLKNMNYAHLRYVDDIRVFCGSLIDAKRVLVDLSRLLRKRGLNLQSAKSEIHRADHAREKIEEVTAVVKSVRNRFISEVVKQTGHGDPYMSVTEADEILEESPEAAPIEVIQETYQAYFVDSGGGFNRTLFRFLLSRLSKQGDEFATAHAPALLEEHPEETDAILDYLGSVGPAGKYGRPVWEFLASGRLVYPYQAYQIVEWFFENTTHAPEELVEAIRAVAFDSSTPRYVKTYCRAFLGNFGSDADLERIADSYDDTADPSEKVEIICSLRRLEPGRRNGFLARVEKDGEMNVRAVKWVKSK
jgi:Reverse transcriptase (RNA-dependent DNA polymerase)